LERYFVDVFTTTPGKGNPAAVVLGGDHLSGAEMAGMAAELGLETTFVSGTTLRYYLPSGSPMMLCGHGTLAALAVLKTRGRTGRFTVSTPAGDLPVSVEEYLLGMAMPGVTFGDPVDPAIAARGLGIDVSEIDGPVQVASAGRPKLMVPLRSTGVLDALAPGATAVEEACAATGATGLYPFTRNARSPGAVADARHFPAGAGIPEDPVTGTAAVALAWYLWRHGAAPGCGAITIEQGHAMGRPGTMVVRQEGDGRTWIYGQAVVTNGG
jgi:trans-2,3-dihydro-3-hydroxyanthranilate isomerase